MSEEQNEINVYQSRRFEKALRKLTETQLKIVEDEIDNIIEKPDIGEIKKGDLSYLRVHKFKMNKQLTLLGYSFSERTLMLELIALGSHENFYHDIKHLS